MNCAVHHECAGAHTQDHQTHNHREDDENNLERTASALGWGGRSRRACINRSGRSGSRSRRGGRRAHFGTELRSRFHRRAAGIAKRHKSPRGRVCHRGGSIQEICLECLWQAGEDAGRLGYRNRVDEPNDFDLRAKLAPEPGRVIGKA